MSFLMATRYHHLFSTPNGLLASLLSVRPASQAAQQPAEINLEQIYRNPPARLTRTWERQGNFCPGFFPQRGRFDATETPGSIPLTPACSRA
jgi:hypothetical protein